MNITPVLFVIIGIAATSLAQILLKIGSSSTIFSKGWIVFLLVSLITYSISFVCYYLALKFYNITKISPIMMASTVSIVAAYGFLAGENINLSNIMGIFLAIFSIVLISKS